MQKVTIFVQKVYKPFQLIVKTDIMNVRDYKIIWVDEIFYTIVDEHRYNYSYLSFVIFLFKKFKASSPMLEVSSYVSLLSMFEQQLAVILVMISIFILLYRQLVMIVE